MQPRQMADNFFGFETSLGAGLDEQLDCFDDEDCQEENYDALNDETFGSDAALGDWEEDHEKLAQITESNRSKLKNDSSKSESEIDVEKSLSHLVLDEKDLTVPRPGVWDSPSNFPITPIPIIPKPSLSALKNACTVEELERGLISNRPPPGLTKQPVNQSSNINAQNLLLNSLTSVEKLPQINGVAPPSGNQFPLVIPPNLRIAHPPSPLPVPNVPNVGQLLNHPANLLNRFQLPPHLLMQTGGLRPSPLRGNFPLNNFPHPNARLGPFSFMSPDHPMIPPHNNHHQSMQHHNLHIGNQRNLNNKFHDRHDNYHQPFFRNNQFYHQNNMRYHNQGHYGHHQNMNHHYHQNNFSSNGIGPYGEQDEYAGLMNHREKQWLHNIQLLQLNTNQPYIDDYYYTVFCDRINKKNENQNHNKTNNNNNAKKSDNMKGGRTNNNNNNSNGYRDSRDREQQQQQQTLPKATTPMQFENSLGKLQYSSVTAPRKIIDMDVVPNSDPQQTPTVQQKDMKKTRQLLMEIERMYVLLLKLEDKGNLLAILADLQREQQLKEQQLQEQQEGAEPVPVPEKKDPIKEKEELVLSIMTSLLQFVQEDKLTSLFSIRKGKMLFLRFLSCLDIKEQEQKLNKLWVGIIKGLAMIGRRDSQLLINFYTEFHKCMNVSLLIDLSKEFIESVNQPSKINSLTAALTNKLGLSVISVMLKFADDLSSHENDAPESFAEHWPKFLHAILQCTNSIPVVAPWDWLEADNLRSHLQRYGIVSPLHLKIFELYFTDVNPAQ